MKKLCLILSIVLLLGGCYLAEVPGANPPPEDETADILLPVVETADNLLKLLESRPQKNITAEGAPESEFRAATASQDSTYSATNVQVQGIDEGDVVKTDGSYLYHIAGNKVLITQAWPLEITREIKVEGFLPNTLYVDENYLVVIGVQTEEDPNKRESIDRCWPYFPTNTRVMVYSLADKDNLRLHRDFSLDGFTVTSRKKDHYLYLINSQYTFRIMENGTPGLPWYRDTTTGDQETEIGYDEIYYFPEGDTSDFIMFAALDLEEGKLEIDTYLGWAQNIYMSEDNLYIALSDGFIGDTSIHKFSVDGLRIQYKGKGTVAGNPLNQFSMDEHKGHFRIATTQQTKDGSANNIYVLDEKMNVAGKIKGLAPGETIFAARFRGDMAYLVTFETMDPLFVIDLSNPKKPKVLGELKIPGFSNYLHPLDDNHLLGIGQDTVVSKSGGREFVTTKGLKLAIFDVSNVNKPKEKFAVTLGDSGSWSEALYDHKAVFFHKGVLAVPANLTRGKDNNANFAFQGALFFDIDVDKGINELGRIAHTPANNPEDGIFYWNLANVRRIVQIDDIFYTFSDFQVMAHNASNFEKLAELDLPEVPTINYRE